ncbi:MAG TPA: von Willebrand factor type A domain-containing protein [Kofleriaceae bacterium]|nr:von Willebrand factor type A domain-containing protein [Kofleriaceae bacterium]
MRIRHVLFALVIAFGGAVAADTPQSSSTAQPQTTGAIEGVVTDVDSGQPLPGATVVATSPALQGEQVVITDDNGRYRIENLPPGTYTITVYYNDQTVQRAGIAVGVAKSATVSMKIKLGSQGEVISIEDRAPTIDPSSTSQGITITEEYVQTIPVGASYSGSTSLQNTYVVNGLDEEHDTEAYTRIDENPFYRVAERPLSTFSSDVDTASYANIRRFLLSEQLPPPDAVRVEEMLNYFTYAYPAPKGDAPVSITTEVGPSPFHPKYELVRIGLATKPIADDRIPPRNLVFLLDTSGSMMPANKLPLVKDAMNLLVSQLRSEDTVSIVVYAGSAGVVLPPTTGDQKNKIRGALAYLEAGGSTNGGEGIEKAYELARAHFDRDGINRVILATDGDFNVGVTDEGELTRLIEKERDDGIFLTVLGVGMGNVKDSTMEQLADRGNGNYAYLDSLAEARKVLVEQSGATLVTVAKDVKLQIELNPARVAGYRLIGYEDRLLHDQDFNDDKKDAGDLGAGHSVTALYELVPAGLDVPGAKVDKLKYSATTATDASAASELMTVKVRYKPPTENTSKLLTRAVPDAQPSWRDTSVDFRWAAAVAGFGMMLRGSPERGEMTWKRALLLARGALGDDREGYRKELVGLIAKATLLAKK